MIANSVPQISKHTKVFQIECVWVFNLRENVYFFHYKIDVLFMKQLAIVSLNWTLFPLLFCFLCCNSKHPHDCSSSGPLLSEIRKGKFTSTFSLGLYHHPLMFQSWKWAYIQKPTVLIDLLDEAKVLEPS